MMCLRVVIGSCGLERWSDGVVNDGDRHAHPRSVEQEFKLCGIRCSVFLEKSLKTAKPFLKNVLFASV